MLKSFFPANAAACRLSRDEKQQDGMCCFFYSEGGSSFINQASQSKKAAVHQSEDNVQTDVDKNQDSSLTALV